MSRSRPKSETGGPGTDRYVGLTELVRYSGYSKSYLRRAIDNGDLPAYRMEGRRGAELRVRLSDLDSLMQPVTPRNLLNERIARQRHPLDLGPLDSDS